MDESILKSIKDLLGIPEEDKAFDQDVLININAIFSTLYQIGVGIEGHKFIVDDTNTWADTFSDYEDLIDFIKLYTYMKVRLVFDPPTNSSILEALKSQISELEWRILMQADSAKYFENNDSSDSSNCCNQGRLTDNDIEYIWRESMQ